MISNNIDTLSFFDSWRKCFGVVFCEYGHGSERLEMCIRTVHSGMGGLGCLSSGFLWEEWCALQMFPHMPHLHSHYKVIPHLFKTQECCSPCWKPAQSRKKNQRVKYSPLRISEYVLQSLWNSLVWSLTHALSWSLCFSKELHPNLNHLIITHHLTAAIQASDRFI